MRLKARSDSESQRILFQFTFPSDFRIRFPFLPSKREKDVAKVSPVFTMGTSEGNLESILLSSVVHTGRERNTPAGQKTLLILSLALLAFGVDVLVYSIRSNKFFFMSLVSGVNGVSLPQYLQGEKLHRLAV